MFCSNGHPNSDGTAFCSECGAQVFASVRPDDVVTAAQTFGVINPDSAVTAAQTFGLACKNGHPLAQGQSVCPICDNKAPTYDEMTSSLRKNKWLVPASAGVAGVMLLGAVAFFALPSSNAGATQRMSFHYDYPGKTCSETGPVHDGTQVQVSGVGGKLLTTGQLEHGITQIINGQSTCTYVVTVQVPKNVGEYFFRAVGEQQVYRVSRSAIDSTSNGWVALTTISTAVVVATWAGSAYASY